MLSFTLYHGVNKWIMTLIYGHSLPLYLNDFVSQIRWLKYFNQSAFLWWFYQTIFGRKFENIYVIIFYWNTPCSFEYTTGFSLLFYYIFFFWKTLFSQTHSWSADFFLLSHRPWKIYNTKKNSHISQSLNFLLLLIQNCLIRHPRSALQLNHNHYQVRPSQKGEIISVHFEDIDRASAVADSSSYCYFTLYPNKNHLINGHNKKRKWRLNQNEIWF